MRKEIADLVYPVFTYALRVKEQLARGDSPTLSREQAGPKGLLKSESEARRWSDYSGEQSVGASIAGRGSPSSFLGIRYALVCWLDEIFILDSPWRREWNEKKLETELYGTNERNEKFWEQAKRA